MDRARIGVIGAGFWAAAHHLPFLAAQADVDLVGVVRRTEHGLEAFRDAYGLAVATTRVGELLAAGVDGVVVSSPHDLHREHAIAALEAGAHVLVEKPMAVTLADARAIAAAAARSGRRVSLAHGWNYSRLAVWAAESIASGAIGAVTSISGYMASEVAELIGGTGAYGVVEVGALRVAAEADTWARPAAGGGYLYGQLSHLLGLAMAVAPAEPVDVSARAVLLPNGVDSDVAVSVRFAGGAIGSFAGHAHLPGERHALELRIAGDRGVLTLDFERERADAIVREAAGAGGAKRLEPEPPAAAGEGAYRCDGPDRWLVDACLEAATVDRAPAEAGVRAVAVMEAAARSSRTGQSVAIGSL